MANIETLAAETRYFAEVAAPGTPSAGQAVIYVKSDGKIYLKDDAGTETDLTAAGGGSGLGDHGARVYNDAAINLTNGSDTLLTFNQERYDTDAYHSTASNTGRLTIPSGQAGTYLIGANVVYTASSSGWRGLTIRLNGATTIGQSRHDPISNAGSATSQIVSTVYVLAETDYIEVLAFVSAASLQALAIGNYSPEFWLQRIA